MSVEVTGRMDGLDLDPVLRDGYEVHQAALRRGMNVLLLPRQVMMVSRPDGEGGELAFVHGVPSTSTLSAVTFAQDKRMRRAQLVAAGLPVPKGGSYSISNGVKDAKNLIKRIGYPVVIKPSMGDNMIEVHAGLRSEADVDAAIDYLRTHPDQRPTYVKAAYALTLLGDPEEVDGRVTSPRGYRFLVEKQVQGQYLRFLVINGNVHSVLHCPGGSAGSVRGPNYDVTTETHPSLLAIAQSAVRAVAGLAVAAVDVVVDDFRKSAPEQEAWIVELSERPWLAAQASIGEALSRDLGDCILKGHATQSALHLNDPTDKIEVDVHVEGLTDPVAAVGTIVAACRSMGIAGNVDGVDPIEGVAEGALTGDAHKIAWLTELLLDGRLENHRAILVQENQRRTSSSATVAGGSK